MERTRLTEAIWRVVIVGFLAALVAYPIVLLTGSHPAFYVDAAVMFSCALIASVFCYGVVRVAALLAAVAVVGTVLGRALRPVHPPWWTFTAVWVVGYGIWIAVRRRIAPRSTDLALPADAVELDQRHADSDDEDRVQPSRESDLVAQ